jgi:cysteine desulfurase
VRDGVRLAPIIMGGGQERERRSGTHNVAGIVALAEALHISAAEHDHENERLGALRDRLVDGITSNLDDVLETVPRHAKIAGSAHLCIAGIESEALLYLLDEGDVCASAASACASGAMEPSHVLAAMGVERSWAQGALRMSLGSTSSVADVARAVDVVVDAVSRLRGAGPVGARPAVHEAVAHGVAST